MAPLHPHAPINNVRAWPNNSINALLPYGSMILTVFCVLITLYRLYVCEGFIVKLCGKKYTKLDNTAKRTFVNHQVAGTIKLILLFVSAYPVISIIFSLKGPKTPLVAGSKVTLGHMIVVISELFTAMYIFELFFRTTVSPISLLHHIGAIIIAQTALVLGLDEHDKELAKYELALCLLWGAFDVVAEIWPHLAVIIYRLNPTKHRMLARIFKGVTFIELGGTLCETILLMYMFGSAWQHWTIEFKVITPILHLLFSAAQLWGAWVFWGLYKKEQRKADEADKQKNVEAGIIVESDARSSKDADLDLVESKDTTVAAEAKMPKSPIAVTAAVREV